MQDPEQWEKGCECVITRDWAETEVPWVFDLKDTWQIHTEAAESSGSIGVFPTPLGIGRYLASLIMDRVGPSTTCVDPTCGSGALLEAWVREAADRGERDPKVFGIDIDTGLIRQVPAVMGKVAARTGVNIHLRLKQGDILKEAHFESNTVVLANPPFSVFGLRGRRQMDRKFRQELARRFPVMEYKTSLFPAFASQFIRLAPKGALIGLVLPDPVISGRFYRKFREWITLEHRIIHLEVLSQKGFKGPAFGHVVLLVVQKTRPEGTYAFDARFWDGETVKMDRHEVLNRAGIRWWIPKNQEQGAMIRRAMEGPKLSDFVSISSGLIGKNGRSGLIADLHAGPPFLPGISSGKALNAFKQPRPDCSINFERKELKSGFVKARYFEPKLLIRQTGSRVIAAPDFDNLLCTNNVHVVNPLDKGLISGLCGVFNSRAFNMLYQTISSETGRALAQVDIDILLSLPLPKGGSQALLRIGGFVETQWNGVVDMDRLNRLVFELYFGS